MPAPCAEQPGITSSWLPSRTMDGGYKVYAVVYSGPSFVSRPDDYGLWVVQYKTHLGWYIVDGARGECGAEPVVLGPYDNEFTAMTVAEMLMSTDTRL